LSIEHPAGANVLGSDAMGWIKQTLEKKTDFWNVKKQAIDKKKIKQAEKIIRAVF
jgi:hypothetical protein